MNAGQTNSRTRRAGWLLAAFAALAAAPARAAAMPDFGLLDEALVQNVRNGYVDYDGIAANPGFALFISQLAEPVTLPEDRAERLAYYINAYNALAIQGILDGYSPATRFGRYRYFKWREFRLAGKDVTLDQLEHKLIRPMGEARIHFAIVCASLSCPRLSNRAFLPQTLDEQLDRAARGFINDVTRNRFDVAQRTAFVSRIFDWFGADFAAASGSLTAYLARYVADPAVRAALLEGRLEVQYLPYDWELNGRLAAAAQN